METLEQIVADLIARGASQEEINQAVAEWDAKHPQQNQISPSDELETNQVQQPDDLQSTEPTPPEEPQYDNLEYGVALLISQGASQEEINQYVNEFDTRKVVKEEEEQQAYDALANEHFEADKDSIQSQFDKGNFKVGQRDAYDVYKETGKLDPTLLGYDKTNKELDREQERRELIPDWARDGGILEGAYFTVTNQFPQAFKGIQLSGQSSSLEKAKEGLASLEGLDDDAIVTVGGSISPKSGTRIGGKQMTVAAARDHYTTALKEKPAEILEKLGEIAALQDEAELYHNPVFLDGVNAKDLKGAIGRQVPQLVFSAATFGVGAFGQEYGSAYVDNLYRIAEEKHRPADWPEGQPYEPTQEQLLDIIQSGEDQRGVAVGTGAVSGALEFVGAKNAVKLIKGGAPLIGRLLKDSTKKALQKFGGAEGIRVAGSALQGALIEGLTETLQGISQDVGSGIARDKSAEEIAGELDWKKSLEEFAQGGFIGGLIPGLGGSVRVVGGRYRNIKNSDGTTEALDNEKVRSLIPDGEKQTITSQNEELDKARIARDARIDAGGQDLSLLNGIIDKKSEEQRSGEAENFNVIESMTDEELSAQNGDSKEINFLEDSKVQAVSEEEVDLIDQQIAEVKQRMDERFYSVKDFPAVLDQAVQVDSNIQDRNEALQSDLDNITFKVEDGLADIANQRQEIADQREALAAAPEPNPVTSQRLDSKEAKLNRKEVDLEAALSEINNPLGEASTAEGIRAKDLLKKIEANDVKYDNLWATVEGSRGAATDLVSNVRALAVKNPTPDQLKDLQDAKNKLIGSVQTLPEGSVNLSDAQLHYLSTISSREMDLIDAKLSSEVGAGVRSAYTTSEEVGFNAPSQAVAEARQAARSIIRESLSSGKGRLTTPQLRVANALSASESQDNASSANNLYTALSQFEADPQSRTPEGVYGALSQLESLEGLSPVGPEVLESISADALKGTSIDWSSRTGLSVAGKLTGYYDALTTSDRRTVDRAINKDNSVIDEELLRLEAILERQAVSKGRVTKSKFHIVSKTQELENQIRKLYKDGGSNVNLEEVQRLRDEKARIEAENEEAGTGHVRLATAEELNSGTDVRTIKGQHSSSDLIDGTPRQDVLASPVPESDGVVNAYNNVSTLLRVAGKTSTGFSNKKGVAVSPEHRNLSLLKKSLSEYIGAPVREIINLKAKLNFQENRDPKYRNEKLIGQINDDLVAEMKILFDGIPKADKAISNHQDAQLVDSKIEEKRLRVLLKAKNEKLSKIGKGSKKYASEQKAVKEILGKLSKTSTQADLTKDINRFTTQYYGSDSNFNIMSDTTRDVYQNQIDGLIAKKKAYTGTIKEYQAQNTPIPTELDFDASIADLKNKIKALDRIDALKTSDLSDNKALFKVFTAEVANARGIAGIKEGETGYLNEGDLTSKEGSKADREKYKVLKMIPVAAREANRFLKERSKSEFDVFPTSDFHAEAYTTLAEHVSASEIETSNDLLSLVKNRIRDDRTYTSREDYYEALKALADNSPKQDVDSVVDYINKNWQDTILEEQIVESVNKVHAISKIKDPKEFLFLGRNSLKKDIERNLKTLRSQVVGPGVKMSKEDAAEQRRINKLVAKYAEEVGISETDVRTLAGIDNGITFASIDAATTTAAEVNTDDEVVSGGIILKSDSYDPSITGFKIADRINFNANTSNALSATIFGSDQTNEVAKQVATILNDNRAKIRKAVETAKKKGAEVSPETLAEIRDKESAQINTILDKMLPKVGIKSGVQSIVKEKLKGNAKHEGKINDILEQASKIEVDKLSKDQIRTAIEGILSDNKIPAELSNSIGAAVKKLGFSGKTTIEPFIGQLNRSLFPANPTAVDILEFTKQDVEGQGFVEFNDQTNMYYLDGVGVDKEASLRRKVSRVSKGAATETKVYEEAGIGTKIKNFIGGRGPEGYTTTVKEFVSPNSAKLYNKLRNVVSTEIQLRAFQQGLVDGVNPGVGEGSLDVSAVRADATKDIVSDAGDITVVKPKGFAKSRIKTTSELDLDRLYSPEGGTATGIAGGLGRGFGEEVRELSLRSPAEFKSAQDYVDYYTVEGMPDGAKISKKQKDALRESFNNFKRRSISDSKFDFLEDKEATKAQNKSREQLAKKISEDLKLKSFPLTGKRRQSLVYKDASKYKRSKIDQGARDVLLDTRLDWVSRGAEWVKTAPMQDLIDLDQSISRTIMEGYQTQLDKNKAIKEKRSNIAGEANKIINKADKVQDPISRGEVDVEIARRKSYGSLPGVFSNIKRHGPLGALANVLSPASNEDFYGLLDRILPATGKQARTDTRNYIEDILVDPLKTANANYYNSSANFRDKYKSIKREHFGKEKSGNKILSKISPIEVNGAKINNSQAVMIYNYIKDPTLYKKMGKGGVDFKKMEDVVNYIQSDSKLESFADAIPSIYANERGHINNVLNRHGRQGVEGQVYIVKEGDTSYLKEAKKDAVKFKPDAKELEILNKVFRGEIPDQTVYTPFAASQTSDKLVKADFDLFNEEGGFSGYTVMSGNLAARQEAGSLNISGKTVDGMIDQYARGPLRTVSYIDFARNASAFFNAPNLLSAEKDLGQTWSNSMRDSLRRIITGKNEATNTPEQFKKAEKYINRAIGGIMFANTKSAMLQLVSMPNFMTENPGGYIAAMGDPKAISEAYGLIKNSGFFKLRGAKDQDVILDAIAKQEGGRVGRAIDKTLQIGYLPTQIADKFAIAGGGAPYLASKIKQLKKSNPTWSKDRVQAEAMKAFVHKANEAQQSTAPDRLGRIQTSNTGRYILAFTNATQQFNRVIAKNLRAAQAGENVIGNVVNASWFIGGQYLMFSFFQKAMANAFDDEDEDDKKWSEYAYGVADSMATSTGLYGTLISTILNAGRKAGLFDSDNEDKNFFEKQKQQTKFIEEIINLSPAVGTKTREFNYGFLDKKLYPQSVISKHISEDFTRNAYKIQSLTGIPLARAQRIVEGLGDAYASDDLDTMQRLLRAIGWSRYDLQKFIDTKEGYIKDEGGQYQYTPLNRIKGYSGDVMGVAYKVGSIQVDPNLSPLEKEKTIAHEKQHIKDLDSGQLDYTETHVIWKGRKYKRDNGKIMFRGKWVPEGHPSLPWENKANKAESSPLNNLDPKKLGLRNYDEYALLTPLKRGSHNQATNTLTSDGSNKIIGSGDYKSPLYNIYDGYENDLIKVETDNRYQPRPLTEGGPFTNVQDQPNTSGRPPLTIGEKPV